MSDTTDTELPPLYTAVLAAMNATRAAGSEPMRLDDIGQAAWNSLTPYKRRAALPSILGIYVQRVIDEQHALAADHDAHNPDLHTYLDPADEAIAWDAYHDDNSTGQSTIERDTLLNILCELDLLRHRLDMARRQNEADA